MAASCLVLLPSFPLRAWRWRILVETQGTALGPAEALNSYAYAIVIGAATPGRLGELVKIGFLRRKGASTSAALLSVGMDRMLDVLFLVIVATGALAALFVGRSPSVVLPVLLGTAISCAAALRYAVSAHGERTAARLCRRLLPATMSGRLLSALASMTTRANALSPATFAATALLTCLAWLVTYLSLYLCVVALGLDVPFLDICGITAVASLVTFLPISILGLGTREASLIAMLSPYGVPAADAVALSALYLAVTLWGVLACAYSLLTPAPGATHQRL